MGSQEGRVLLQSTKSTIGKTKEDRTLVNK
jgi:hypothetical protein